MCDRIIEAVIKEIKAETEALAQYRRAAQLMEQERDWAERDGWDEEIERADRLLGHLRGEIRELETAD